MFEIRNEAERVEILIYDRIGKSYDWWTDRETGVSAEDIREALKDADGKPVDFRIDSPGGDVFEGFAICSAIQAYEGETSAYVDGLAASAASYIAVVCDNVIMSDYAYLMIHCAWAMASGNARALEGIAERLRNIDKNLAEIYRKRSNLSLDEVIAYMEDETWFTADKAFEVGLCTEVIETEERIAACIGEDIAEHYRNIPQGIAVKARAKNVAKPAVLPAVEPTEDEPEPAPQTEDGDASHSETTITDEAEKTAEYRCIGGKAYRKDM